MTARGINPVAEGSATDWCDACPRSLAARRQRAHPEGFDLPSAHASGTSDPDTRSCGMHVGTAKEKLGEILVREGWITAEQR